MKTYKIYSVINFEIYSMVLFTVDTSVLYYIPSVYLLYNRKFVPFDHLPFFNIPCTHIS